MHSKQSKFKRITVIVLAVINVLLAAVLLISAFSGMLPPHDYPRMSVLPLFFPFFLLANIFFLVLWLFIRRKMMLISAIAMLACITDIRAYFPLNMPENVPDDAIRIISMNLGTAKNKAKNPAVEFFIDQNADILCLQEVCWRKNWIDDLRVKEQFPYIRYIDRKCKMFCLSKYPIVRAEEIAYNGGMNMSMAVWLEINNDTLLLVNNHFQSYGIGKKLMEEYTNITKKSTSLTDREKGTKDVFSCLVEGNRKRGPQVDMVCRFLDEHPQRLTVVCGDFNETANGYAHYKLTKNLHDAFTLAGNGFGFTYSRNKIHYRIDHILCSDAIEPFDCHIDKSCNLSDHFPIICDLKLQ